MANCTVATAICMCTFGAAPAPLMVTSQQTALVCGQPAATIMDKVFPTFGMCSNPANPTVAAATAAALGALTPMPCIPNAPAPWVPGCPTVMIGGKPALNNTSKLMCAYPGGIIQVQMPIAMTVMLP
ncbi:MAG: DUF4280 domain-containing protein [Oscillospiraceae bacterium]|nr:DUF4280 domain-containing protein [Oscillospiraceae bacterium]